MTTLNEMGQTYHRPWGWYKTIDMQDTCQVKVIEVKPGGRLSLQSHKHRAEHWTVTQGTATITVDDLCDDFSPNSHVYIPQQAKHRLENHTNAPVRIIEVQIGDYLGEDDIVRYDDIYGRA